MDFSPVLQNTGCIFGLACSCISPGLNGDPGDYHLYPTYRSLDAVKSLTSVLCTFISLRACAPCSVSNVDPQSVSVQSVASLASSSHTPLQVMFLKGNNNNNGLHATQPTSLLRALHGLLYLTLKHNQERTIINPIL